MLLKKYQDGGKAKKEKEPYYSNTRELAGAVYRKQMKGEPLVGYEKEYSKSGSYRAFQSTKPFGEIGHLRVTGQTGDAPKPEKLSPEFYRSAGASALAKAKAHIKKKRKGYDYDKGGKVLKKYKDGGKANEEEKKKDWKTKSKTEKRGSSSIRWATGQNEETRSDTMHVSYPKHGEAQSIRHTKKGEEPTYEFREKYKGGTWKSVPSEEAEIYGKAMPTPKKLDEYHKKQKLRRGGKAELLQKQSGREFRKGLEGAPDLDDDLWTKFQSRGNLVLPQLLEEQKKRDSGAKIEKARKRTKTIEKATGLKYPESAGGSLPHGEGGKKKKKTTNMPHGMYSVTKGVKGKMPQHKLMKKAKLLKKKEIA